MKLKQLMQQKKLDLMDVLDNLKQRKKQEQQKKLYLVIKLLYSFVIKLLCSYKITNYKRLILLKIIKKTLDFLKKINDPPPIKNASK